MPMNPRLLRPRSTVHPEANAWATRVIANGGTFSSSTLSAVSTFCASIDRESGLRAAILRLNLFCGNNLEACLVPLYRGASLSGTQLGNTTDTNNGPFVSGDYSATGATGGLTGNGTSKYLNTGLPQNEVGSGTSGHLSISGTGFATVGENIAVGAYNGSAPNIDDLNLAHPTDNTRYRSGSFIGAGISNAASYAHLLGTKETSTLNRLYVSGVSAGTNNGGTLTRSTRPYFVFCLNNVGTAFGFVTARMRMYSIGNTVTSAQALALSNAVVAFNTALGRA
jgi:hypothetical protein